MKTEAVIDFSTLTRRRIENDIKDITTVIIREIKRGFTRSSTNDEVVCHKRSDEMENKEKNNTSTKIASVMCCLLRLLF